jgi:hypothetical protein
MIQISLEKSLQIAQKETMGEEQKNRVLRENALKLEKQLLSQAESKGEQVVVTDLEARLKRSHTESTEMRTQYRTCLVQLKNAHEQIQLLQATMDRERDESEKRVIWEEKNRKLAEDERLAREQTLDAEKLMREQVLDAKRLRREKIVEEAHNQRDQEQTRHHQQVLDNRQQELRDARKRGLEREEEFRNDEERAEREIQELRATLQESRQREREMWEKLKEKADAEEEEAWEDRKSLDAQKLEQEEVIDKERTEQLERHRSEQEMRLQDEEQVQGREAAERKRPGPAVDDTPPTNHQISSPNPPPGTLMITPSKSGPSPSRNRGSFGFPSNTPTSAVRAPGPAAFFPASPPVQAPGPAGLEPAPTRSKISASITKLPKPSATKLSKPQSGLRPPSTPQSLH